MFFLMWLIMTNVLLAKENKKKQVDENIQQQAEKLAQSLTLKKTKKNIKSYLALNENKLTPIQIKYLQRVLNWKKDRLKLVFERVVLNRLKKENNALYLELLKGRETDKTKFNFRLIDECLLQYKADLKSANNLRKDVVKYQTMPKDAKESVLLRKQIKKMVAKAFDRRLKIEKESLSIIYKGYYKSVALTANREYFFKRLVNERFNNIVNGVAVKNGGRASHYNNNRTKTGVVRGLKIAKRNRENFINKFDKNISSDGIDQSLVNLNSNQLLRMSYLKVAKPELYKKMVALKKRNYKNFLKQIAEPECDIMLVVHTRDEKIYELYKKYKSNNKEACLTMIKAIIKEQLVERLALEKEVLRILKKGYEINKSRYEKRVANKKKIVKRRVDYLLRDKDLDWFSKK